MWEEVGTGTGLICLTTLISIAPRTWGPIVVAILGPLNPASKTNSDKVGSPCRGEVVNSGRPHMDNHPLNGQSRLSRRQPRDYRVTQRVTPYGGRSECAGGLQNAALSAGTAVPGPRCEGHNSEATVRRPQFGRLPIISHEPDLRLPDALSLPRGFRPYIRSQPPGTSGTVAPTSGRCSYGPSYSIGLT